MEDDVCKSKMTKKYLNKMEEKIFHVKHLECKKVQDFGVNSKVEKYLKREEEKKCKKNVHGDSKKSSHLLISHPRGNSRTNSNHSNKFNEELQKKVSERHNNMIKIEQPEILVKESIVQIGNGDKCIIELLKKSSERSLASSTTSKRSSSVPPLKKPIRKFNSKNVDLFNPNYPSGCDSLNGSSIGRSLLESIRSKVFGYKPVENYAEDEEDETEWACKSDPNICFDKVSSLRFPKETRHAITNMIYSRHSKLCVSCCNQIKKIKTIDAQTSPFNSKTKLKAPKTSIPCPFNLLCDKGIHIGKCEEHIRNKIHEPCCQKNCECRKRKKETVEDEKKKHPGSARSSPKLLETVLAPKGDVSCESTLSENSSMNTILKLMEPQASRELELEPDSFIEPFLQLMEPQIKHKKPVQLPPLPAPIELFDGAETRQIMMNGMNGHTNGELNGCGDIITQNQQKGCWTIGLINSKYRYLTAETFGFKINANGASLKKKQIWTLEPENANGGDSLIYLKSHLDKYLAVDSFGNVTCESDEKEPGCVFQISVSEDGTGRWALKNVVRGYFLGSTLDKLTCTAKVPGDSEFWHIHLAARPQVNLRSVGRKRFAHLSENLDEIHVDANIPWGEDTLFTLEFRLDESGKYAIHTCNNKYLSLGGKLVDTCNKDCLFSAEYHSGQLALRDRTGAYLSPIGSKAVLKTRSNTVTKDELFSLEDSLPQASFVASLNSRFVSVKQGVDVTANQDEISDHETFQLEFDWTTKRWYIRTMQDRYWTLETGGGIQASGDKRSSNALFDLIWQGDGSVAFRANNGRYIITKRSGHLYATADTIDENCKYYFYLINRPILVLKCEQGFVGFKSASSPKLECNKATYECIQVERGEKGVVYFKGQNGKYWHVDSEGVTADSDSQEGFYLELREPTRLCIKSVNGNYLTASKNGLFRLGDVNFDNATQWEY